VLGLTVVYSFMQVAGIVNDHLLICFRHHECNSNMKKDLNPKIEETKEINEVDDKRLKYKL
jgi:DNA-3-methyladenine glycosylase I